MKTEKSCGAVVYTEKEGKILYLLIRDKEGIYGFPKGHTEDGETEEETALREILEETGLRVELRPGFRTEDSHPIPGRDVMKIIVYFTGYYEGQTPAYQEEELSGTVLCSYEEAMGLFQYDSSRRILTEADRFLHGKT